MKQRVSPWLAALVVTLLMAFLPSTAFAVYSPQSSGKPAQTAPEYLPDRILVKPKKGVRASEMGRLHASHKARVLRAFARIGRLQEAEA